MRSPPHPLRDVDLWGEIHDCVSCGDIDRLVSSDHLCFECHDGKYMMEVYVEDLEAFADYVDGLADD